VTVVLLVLASSACAETAFRHQFQYALKPEYKDRVDEVVKRWTGFAEKAPANGKPLIYQFGKDLGIAPKLYNLAINNQMDFAGRLDFPSEGALRAFWAATYQDPLWQELTGKWVKSAHRIQYIVNTCGYPAAGSYVRHSFEYQPKPSVACASGVTTEAGGAFTSADAQRLVRAWFKFCSEAPAKPVSCVFGADLGIGSELYPNAGKTNMAFGGSLDFKSETDMTVFWKWIVGQQLYKDITKDNLQATRVQYAVAFK